MNGRVSQLDLAGTNDHLTGTFTVRAGTEKVTSAVTGHYAADTRKLTLADVEDVADRLRYVGTISTDGTAIEGTAEGIERGSRAPFKLTRPR